MTYPKEFVGLRGLAAAYVLIRHSLASLPQSSVGDFLDNNYGVKLFMIVSGFSIYWMLDTRKPTYGRYIAGRFFRIFPVYLVGLVVYSMMLSFIQQTFVDAPTSALNVRRLELIHDAQSHLVAHFLAHLTLLHGLVPSVFLPSSDYTLLGQAWSLSVERQLYLIAPFIIQWLSTIEKPWSRLCLIILVLILLLAGNALGAGYIGNNLAMFAIGIACYRFTKVVACADARPYLVVVFLLAAIARPTDLPTILVWLAAFYGALGFDKGPLSSTISGVLCSRPLAYLGRISYSFYIFHMTALFLCLRLIDRTGTPQGLRYYLLPLSSFALTILLSELSYRFIERPCHRFGKKMTRLKSGVPDGTPPELASELTTSFAR